MTTGTRTLSVFAPLGTPLLPDALCLVDPQLFDYELDDERRAEQKKRHEAAARLCRGCSALAACAAWVETAPREEISGVIAGEIYAYRLTEDRRRSAAARKARREAACLDSAA